MGKQGVTQRNDGLPIDVGILDGLTEPVALLGRDHRVVDCNRAAQNLLGAKALGMDLASFLGSEDLPHIVEKVLKGEPGSQIEVSIPFPVSRTYELSVWRLPDLKSEGPAWCMVILHDITAAKKAEQMRADFVANVSHELRSPLSSLLGFIETLRGPARDDPEASDRFLKIMEGEAKRMTRLISDLLALSKVETEEHISPEGTVDLKKMLVTVADILSVNADERGMKIRLKGEPPMTRIIGDPDELIQVFQNLIGNAISYGSEKSTVEVIVKDVDVMPNTGGAGLSVAVINQGEGIQAEDIPRITERFYRVDKGRSRAIGGTGLGLAIVKHIVARHRGHMEVQSIPGAQTTFTVYLPRPK